MMYGHSWMFGAWIIVILISAVPVAVLLVLLLRDLLLRRRPGMGSLPARSAALEILEKRYGTGDLSTAEFEERKAHLRSG